MSVSIDNRQRASMSFALEMFQQAAVRVPAYGDFLAKNGVKPGQIATTQDLAQVPPVDKDNYLTQYPVNELLWDGSFDLASAISTSSGSSGVPFFWFRGEQSTEDSIVYHDRILTHSFKTREKATLCIVSFAMGSWIAGTYTYSALMALADMGHRIVTVTPGINCSEVLDILDRLAPRFEQVLLMGYPPFVKDVLDKAETEGIDLARLDVKLLFAGEGFTENWRDYVCAKIGKVGDIYATAAIYGTADAGAMGYETPRSIQTRRLAGRNAKLADSLCLDSPTLPTLVQYDPALRYTQTDRDGFLLFTVNNAMPLIRYRIKDKGRLFSSQDMGRLLQDCGEKALPRNPYTDYPFIALYGRDDISTTFYGLNIYPENIRAALECVELCEYTTGKFVLTTVLDDTTQDQELDLCVELKAGGLRCGDDLSKLICERVTDSLRRHNKEYNRLYEEMGACATPTVRLGEYGAKEFTIGVKHRWTARQ